MDEAVVMGHGGGAGPFLYRPASRGRSILREGQGSLVRGQSGMRRSSRQVFLSATLIVITCGAFGQSSISADQPNSGQSANPVVISLSDAIKRAQQNEPSFASAV